MRSVSLPVDVPEGVALENVELLRGIGVPPQVESPVPIRFTCSTCQGETPFNVSATGKRLTHKAQGPLTKASRNAPHGNWSSGSLTGIEFQLGDEDTPTI